MQPNDLDRHTRVTREPGAKPGAGAAGDALPAHDGADEPPPVLGSWAALYAVVIAGLLLMIALCAAITWWAA